MNIEGIEHEYKGGAPSSIGQSLSSLNVDIELYVDHPRFSRFVVRATIFSTREIWDAVIGSSF